MKFMCVPQNRMDEVLKVRVAALICGSFDTPHTSLPWHRMHSIVGLELDDLLVSVLLVTFPTGFTTTLKPIVHFEKVCTAERMRGQGHASALLRFAMHRFSPAMLHVARQPGHDKLVNLCVNVGFIVFSTNSTETALIHPDPNFANLL